MPKFIGFKMIDDKKIETIEKIKNAVITLVHHSDNGVITSLPLFIAAQIHQDYNYLSTLFSEVEDTVIEKYFTAQKIENVKELLVYNELPFFEIADHLSWKVARRIFSMAKKKTGSGKTMVIAYTLPMLFVADFSVDGNCKFRFQFGREDLPVTKLLRFNIIINTDQEYAAGFRYIPIRHISVGTHYDSDMRLAAGIVIIC